jgi:fatty acid-binding protein DegV
MGKIIGIIAKLSKLKLICGDNGAGEIVKCGIALTTKNALNTMSSFPADASKEDPNPSVVISHCFNEDDANKLKTQIVEKLNLKNIKILPMRGLACFYADFRGIVMAY